MTATVGFGQTNFVQITNVAPVTALFDGAGCAFVDYDNDGYVDLFVGDYSGNNRLYHNQHDGTFLAITNGAIVNEGANESYCLAWGDFNNDGFPDLFVGNGYGSGRPNFLYRNNGDGTFTKITTGTIVTDRVFSSGCAWADYDGDGFIDLFVANHPGASLVYHNEGGLAFTRINSIPSVASDAVGVAWSDFNNDGLPDLFVANGYSTGSALNFLYRNLGGGAFSRVSGTNFVSPFRASVGVAWGDYDNDGFPDVFVANLGQGNELYHNTGNGSLTRVTAGRVVNDLADSTSAAWGDYDNDGHLDLFVGNRTGAKNFLYHNNGNGTFTWVTSGPIADGIGENGGCAWGDYDNDGFLDLYVSNLGPPPSTGGLGRAFLYHNTGNSNHWLKVKCVGVASNRMTIGAKVRVQATINGVPTWQLREITTGHGSGSAALTAHFGLGDAANVELVRIEWPSGIVQTLANVAPKQFLTVVEHQEPGAGPPEFSSVSRAASGEVNLSVAGDTGLLYVLEASTNLLNWLKVSVRSNATGIVGFTDTRATNYARRFYRVSIP